MKAVVEIRAGYSITVRANESDKQVELALDWTQTGETKYESIRKYLGPAAETASSKLKKSGWKIESKEVSTTGARIAARLQVHNLNSKNSIKSAAIGLDEAIKALRLN